MEHEPNDRPDGMAEVPSPAPVPDPAAASALGGSPVDRRKRAWLGMGAVVVALVLLTMLPGPAIDPDAPPPAADDGAAAPEGAVAGAMAPLDFTLKDMNGADVTLTSFEGKIILLNFWATWCGPCRIEIPDLIELQRQYPDDLVVLGVSVDDTAEKLRPYAASMKINYPLLVGNGRQDFQDAYGPFWGIPVSVYVTRDGRIHKKHSGIASKAQIEFEIKSLL